MSIDMRRSHRDRKQTDFFHFKDGKTNSDEINDDDEEDVESRLEAPERKEKKVVVRIEDDESIGDDNIEKIDRVKPPKKATKKNVNKKIAVSTNNIIFGKIHFNVIYK